MPLTVRQTCVLACLMQIQSEDESKNSMDPVAETVGDGSADAKSDRSQ
jgi:hypothetical protein